MIGDRWGVSDSEIRRKRIAGDTGELRLPDPGRQLWTIEAVTASGRNSNS
jgi:hypothetical protein